VDLFAGTGAVALEAHSRGYGPVVCVEQHPVALACLAANLRDTPVRLLKQDALKMKADAFTAQALVFADPPYDKAAAAFQHLAPRIRAWMAPGSVLVWETDARTTLAPCEGWTLLETRDYGAARFHLLVPEFTDSV
jgi:16S rRNA (guanine966-N2)-methyltransferase